MHTVKKVHRSLIVREVAHTKVTVFLVYIVCMRSFSEITCFLKRERENQQDATIRCLLSTLSQHVSGIIMPFFRKTKTVCYCMRCTALVLLDVVGSGCGALRCRVRAL